jgi:hypothetical protein
MPVPKEQRLKWEDTFSPLKCSVLLMNTRSRVENIRSSYSSADTVAGPSDMTTGHCETQMRGISAPQTLTNKARKPYLLIRVWVVYESSDFHAFDSRTRGRESQKYNNNFTYAL